jgi:hypothetical protein
MRISGCQNKSDFFFPPQKKERYNKNCRWGAPFFLRRPETKTLSIETPKKY